MLQWTGVCKFLFKVTLTVNSCHCTAFMPLIFLVLDDYNSPFLGLFAPCLVLIKGILFPAARMTFLNRKSCLGHLSSKSYLPYSLSRWNGNSFILSLRFSIIWLSCLISSSLGNLCSNQLNFLIPQTCPILLHLHLFHLLLLRLEWNFPSISSLDKWFFKCGEQSSSNSITWELVRHSYSQLSTRPTEWENSGVGSSNLWFNKHIGHPKAGLSLRRL